MDESGRRSSAAIKTADPRLRVFVLSPLNELAAERETARAAIEQLQLAPVMFESGARPHLARSVYWAYLEQSDVFVGISWQRYGWLGPGMAISGLEDELQLAGAMPRLLYFKAPAPEMDTGLARMLDTIGSEGSPAYKTFTDAAELRVVIATDLATLLAERFGGAERGGRSPVLPSPVTALVGRDADVAEVTAGPRALPRTSELWQQIESLPEEGLRADSDRMARSYLTASRLVNDGSCAEAVMLDDEILPDARRLQKPWRTALMIMGRGLTRPYEAHSPARADFEEVLPMVRKSGDPLALGYVLAHYGAFLCVDGDPARAQALHEEMLQIARSLGDQNLRAEAHYDLAMDPLSAVEVPSAQPHLAVAVQHYRKLDHLDGLTRCLGALSALALARGLPRPGRPAHRSDRRRARPHRAEALAFGNRSGTTHDRAS